MMFLDTLQVNYYEMKMCYSLIYMKCNWLNLKELFMVRLSFVIYYISVKSLKCATDTGTHLG